MRNLMRKFTSSRYVGRHRGTEMELTAQNIARAERFHAARRAELIEFGSRSDWKLS